MTRGPVDELASRLFEAARQEQPDAQFLRRVADASRQGERLASGPRRWSASRWRFRVGAALAAAALVGGVLLLLPRQHQSIDIAPEAVHGVAGRSVQQAASLRSPEPPRATEESPDAPASAPPDRSAGRAGGPTRETATLADELAALQRARVALGSGDTNQALRELDRYQSTWKGRQLDAEASLLRIEALSSAGQTERAAAEARRFVQQNPNSPLVDRARGFLEQPSEDGVANEDEGRERVP